jgi:hypothetical protein
MKRLLLLTIIMLAAWTALSAQSFRKGYKAYAKKHNYPAASAILKKHLEDKFGAGSRLYLALMAEHTTNQPDSLLALDSILRVANDRWTGLSHRKAARQVKKFGISQESIRELRKRLQVKAIDLVRARNSVTALDSLLARLTAPLPEVTPYLDSNRVWIVNSVIDSWDYATVTSILNTTTGRRLSPAITPFRGDWQTGRLKFSNAGIPSVSWIALSKTTPCRTSAGIAGGQRHNPHFVKMTWPV